MRNNANLFEETVEVNMDDVAGGCIEQDVLRMTVAQPTA